MAALFVCVLARAGAAREHRHRGDLGRDRARRDRAGRRRARRRASSRCNAAAATGPEQVDRSDKAEEKATEQPQTVQVATRGDRARADQTLEQPKADERSQTEPTIATAAAPRSPRRPSRSRRVAMVESPTPDMATATPQEMPPDTTEVSLLPQPEEKPVENEAASRSRCRPRRPKPVKDAKPAKERAPHRRADAREGRHARPRPPRPIDRGEQRRRRPLQTATPTIRASSRRICAATSSIPSDARSRGDQGTATVSFSLDGGGGVTSARLARGSGVASIDQEVQAMVRRASPFPAPPDGRPRSFTVPVSFRLN